MQPWRKKGLLCSSCSPSCQEPQINVVGRTSKYGDAKLRNVSIRIMALPSQRFFRQAVREKIDIVGELVKLIKFVLKSFLFLVSIGGISSLFLGASILSFFELFYFLIFRTFKN